MRTDERLELARTAYRRALGVVRAEATAATWRRALAASRYLDEALRSQHRGLRRALDGAGGRTVRAPPGRRSSRQPARTGGGARAAAPSRRGRDAAGAAVHLEAMAALRAELARGRALVARARELVARSRALQASLAELVEVCRGQQRALASAPCAG